MNHRNETKRRGLVALAIFIMCLASAHRSIAAQERQLTTARQSHILTNINVWSPDGAWLVYDIRSGGEFDGARIERVNVRTGGVQCLYESENGAHCGVVTSSPTDDRVVFIHGPEHPTAEWNYGFSRRRGAVVNVANPGVSRPLDAMTYALPFTPGALRGGSHVHVFSPDGEWVSFTYEDDVLAQLDANPQSPPHEPNQRNVGVSVPAGPVRVDRAYPRNHDGDWFSVVVTRTVARPRPGSDEISRAFEEGWVGENGYVRADGRRQHRALAFQGLVTARDGSMHAEVFIADLPNDLTKEGDRPLAGTSTTRPAPPRGVSQRRLTFTNDRVYPGVATEPRHWLRVSPDGEAIAFLMRDDTGIVQLWTVSPRGGEPAQLTRNSTSIASAFTWSPDGAWIAHVMDGSVCISEVATGETRRLTVRSAPERDPSPQACVFSPDGSKIAFTRVVEGFQQIFVVEVPSRSTITSIR